MKTLLSTACAAALLIGGVTLASAQETGAKTIPGKVEEGGPAKTGANAPEAQPTPPTPGQPNSPADKNAKMLNEGGASTGTAAGSSVTPPTQSPPKSIPDKERQTTGQ